jgi:uncharacterized glyoxalase superfamily protein PhnB
MSSDWKPQGYSTVSVYIVTEGAQRVIDFLKQTFDAEALAALPRLRARSCTPKCASGTR